MYSLLGRSLERVWNTSYEDYLSEEVFAPLGTTIDLATMHSRCNDKVNNTICNCTTMVIAGTGLILSHSGEAQ